MEVLSGLGMVAELFSIRVGGLPDLWAGSAANQSRGSLSPGLQPNLFKSGHLAALSPNYKSPASAVPALFSTNGPLPFRSRTPPYLITFARLASRPSFTFLYGPLAPNLLTYIALNIYFYYIKCNITGDKYNMLLIID